MELVEDVDGYLEDAVSLVVLEFEAHPADRLINCKLFCSEKFLESHQVGFQLLESLIELTNLEE
jgi:hypothetical protein